MKAYAFYVSDNPGPNRQKLNLPDGGACYVRVQLFQNADCADALNAAEPESDENLMNTFDHLTATATTDQCEKLQEYPGEETRRCRKAAGHLGRHSFFY